MFRLLLLVLCMTSVRAFAFPMPSTHLALISEAQNLETSYHFDGIVALYNCSGSLIQFEGAKSTDQAMVLTNGHCFDEGMPGPGKFVANQKSGASFNLLNDQSRGIASLHATDVLYSTMTQTDITIYKLKETYELIEKNWGARPLTLSSKHPVAGTSINVVSGYWKRGYSCKIDAFVNELSEDGWMFKDSIRYSRPGCEIIGGTSGSPIIEEGTRNVIGINNTVNEDGGKCTLDNPCEIDQDGKVTYEKGLGYGQETYIIYSCVNADHQFDLTTPGCQLLH